MKTSAVSVLLIVACACLASCRTDRPTGADPARGAAERATKPGRHPADAIAFGGHWYKVFQGDLSWHEKKQRCEALGGYLACVETREEQDFIAKLAEGQYLSLGATDEANEDNWVWVNGAKFEHLGWMEGQPNNYGGDENYLATYDGGQWVDVAVEGTAFWMPTGFICEWER